MEGKQLLSYLTLGLLLLVSEKCEAQRSKSPSSIWFYNAPARDVPFFPVDTDIKRGLLEIFRLLPTSQGFAPSEPVLDPAVIARVNELVPPNASFRGFFPSHQLALDLLVEAIANATTQAASRSFSNSSVAAEFLRVIRRQILNNELNNPLNYFAAIQTLLRDPGLIGYNLAWAADSIPDWYITSTAIEKALANPSVCSLFNGTEGATGGENPLWYYREDIDLNQDHWYWHAFFPTNFPRGFPENLRKHWDRRGEHFSFFHHNMIARYNAERLSNGLEPEIALDLRPSGDIGEGYNSYMIDKSFQESQEPAPFTPREAHTLLQNAYRPDLTYPIEVPRVVNAWNDLRSHLSSGYLVIPDNSQFNVNHSEAIDHVGNTVEASNLNLNRQRYLEIGLHNTLHNLVGVSSDPNKTLGTLGGVIAEPTTAPRDPAFYQIHTLIDEVFAVHKQALEPYQLRDGIWPLVWDGVRIRKLGVEIPGGRWGGKTKNVLNTFWNVKSFPLEQGIMGRIHDGTTRPEICQQHLDHERFTFKLMVDFEGTERVKGNVRLFLAPRHNLDGRRTPLTRERTQLFQLDVFPVELRPGRNLISRRSSDSSSTRPWSRSLDQMIADPNNGGKPDYCGCGMPEHLYLPKGTKQGMAYDLFAIITNFEEDKVQETEEELRTPEGCNSPYIFCGIPHRKYPDRRPMGYPFDRLPYRVNGQEPRTLEEYARNVPNSFMNTVVIRHEDVIRNSS